MPVLKNPQHEQFAVHYSQGEHRGNATRSAIAANYTTVSAEVTGWRLLRNAKITERIAELTAAANISHTHRAISVRENRIAWLDERSSLLRRVISERAAHEDFALAPGGKTGLLVKTYKQVGAGPQAQLVEEFAVDTGMLKEMRAHEEQAAKELGQWIEKRDDKRSLSLEDVGDEVLREWVQNAAKQEVVQ